MYIPIFLQAFQAPRSNIDWQKRSIRMLIEIDSNDFTITIDKGSPSTTLFENKQKHHISDILAWSHIC